MTLSMAEKDRRFIWHPSTQMKDYETEDHILITEAEGIRLYDNKGNSYFDTISSWWCNIHGHNHPRIREAISNQVNSLEHVLFAGFTHENAILVAERLVQITPPNLTKVFYSDNGSTACEVALKMSHQFWRNIEKKEKERFVCLELGYHGDTVGAMSVGGTAVFREQFEPLLFPSYQVPSPYCYRCRFGKDRATCDIDCMTPLREILQENHDKIAAIIIEPLVQAAGGMIVYPVEYLNELGKLAKEHNVHLIVDEVAVGFGRTGNMFATEYATIEPDFMCISKGLTNGSLPLAATLTTEDIYQAFYDDYAKNKTFQHGHTFTANPVATAAALASLRVFQEENTLARVAEVIRPFHRDMDAFRELPYVGDVRCIGMIGALELVEDKNSKRPFPSEERIGWQVYQAGLKLGLILRPLGNITYLFLPLCTRHDELSEILDRMRMAILTIR